MFVRVRAESFPVKCLPLLRAEGDSRSMRGHSCGSCHSILWTELAVGVAGYDEQYVRGG